MIDFTEYIDFFQLLSILMKILIFFYFSISWCVVKMIDLTVYMIFSRLFDLLVGGKNDQFH